MRSSRERLSAPAGSWTLQVFCQDQIRKVPSMVMNSSASVRGMKRLPIPPRPYAPRRNSSLCAATWQQSPAAHSS